MSLFDEFFAAQSDHLTGFHGEIFVKYRPPHGSDDGSDDETISECLASDQQAERRPNQDGDLEIVQMRKFNFPGKCNPTPLVGGWMLYGAEYYYIESASRGNGKWHHVDGLYIGRLEASGNIIQ